MNELRQLIREKLQIGDVEGIDIQSAIYAEWIQKI